ncbi:mucin-2-like [Neocloeon triangulifer]|uniref:mucin-2-like n=1 Tax=Neocloeon triangulifer TaxID=2078957 RepID=UPI00286EC678|nr:mucin-2-like [Neocloeon triangulifer]
MMKQGALYFCLILKIATILISIHGQRQYRVNIPSNQLIGGDSVRAIFTVQRRIRAQIVTCCGHRKCTIQRTKGVTNSSITIKTISTPPPNDEYTITDSESDVSISAVSTEEATQETISEYSSSTGSNEVSSDAQQENTSTDSTEETSTTSLPAEETKPLVVTSSVQTEIITTAAITEKVETTSTNQGTSLGPDMGVQTSAVTTDTTQSQSNAPGAPLDNSPSPLTSTSITTSTSPINTGSASASTTSTLTPSTTKKPTTTTIPCKKPSCDPSVFARRRRRKRAVVPPKPSDGTFSRACNKTFFFGSNPVSWSDSYAECQKFGMVSMGIGSPDKQKCATEAASSDSKTANQTYWTSGHKKNATCPKTYAMCDVDKIIGPDVSDILSWVSLLGEDPDKDFCLSMAIMAGAPSGLSNAFCNKKLNIMCEPKCTKPTCPKTCQKNASLFDAKGQLINSSHYGLLLTSSYKNTTYLFSSSTATWQEAWDFCCKIGMKLASIESVAENNALGALVKGRSNMKYHWISLTQVDCVGTWYFCSTNTFVEKGMVVWGTSQPDNYKGVENHVVVVLNTTLGSAKLNDQNLNNKYPFLCK